jgi:hypothetical protein
MSFSGPIQGTPELLQSGRRHYRSVLRDLIARLILGHPAQAWACAGICAMRIGLRSGEVSGSSSTILPFASRQ